MAGRPVHTFEVLRTEQVTPHIVRVVLGGGGFDTFKPNNFTDAYVKIVFVNNGIDVGALPQPLTLDSFNELPPSSGRPCAPTPCAASTPRVVNSPSTSSCTASTASRARGRWRSSPDNRLT